MLFFHAEPLKCLKTMKTPSILMTCRSDPSHCHFLPLCQPEQLWCISGLQKSLQPLVLYQPHTITQAIKNILTTSVLSTIDWAGFTLYSLGVHSGREGVATSRDPTKRDSRDLSGPVWNKKNKNRTLNQQSLFRPLWVFWGSGKED